MKCDLHMHSTYSFDSIMSPRNIVRCCSLRNLSLISVTDHDTMEIYQNEFSTERRTEILETHGTRIIPGMEVNTDRGDIIGLFLDSEITAREFSNVISQIRAQDGLVLLPHPYYRNGDPRELIPDIDIIEVVNGRCKSDLNDRAANLAEECCLPTIGGSDAHIYWEIGHIHTHFDDTSGTLRQEELTKELLIDSERDIRGSPLPFYMTHGVSYASGRLKRLLGRSIR